MERPSWTKQVFLAVALGLSASACAPAATPSPTAAPAKPAATSAPAKPAASPAAKAAEKPAAKFDQAAWDQIVAAAKREGRVSVIGPAGPDIQDALTRAFHAKYPEIQIEWIGPPPPQIPPKIIGERSAGQYLTDLIIVGTTTIIGTLLPANVIEPIQPHLVGANARDESAWRGGKFDFSDEGGRYNLVVQQRVQNPVLFNPTVVSANEFRSFRDLLNPKWKGKIAMLSPEGPGAALDVMTFIYTQPTLGKSVLQQFFTQQDILISREDRQVLDWIARTEYPVGIGPSITIAWEMIQKGVPVELLPGENMREGAFVTASNATIAVVDRAPHPNALKVYLDWLLSREGQLEWSKGSGLASRRTDVPTDHLLPFIVPRPDVQYQENYKEKYVKLREEITAFLKPMLPS